jgi:hypothetical protein
MIWLAVILFILVGGLVTLFCVCKDPDQDSLEYTEKTPYNVNEYHIDERA